MPYRCAFARPREWRHWGRVSERHTPSRVGIARGSTRTIGRGGALNSRTSCKYSVSVWSVKKCERIEVGEQLESDRPLEIQKQMESNEREQ